jgi:hypothetical protein
MFVPNWFTIGLLATIGAFPWTHWRFSLRTLLIVMTLVAVALWVVVAFR